ncbi:hypothetical protein O1L60_01075 [Streptomyces diastatochromogenes]|nr:hypothetical protein [Streptomyces diastatochromogenes]
MSTFALSGIGAAPLSLAVFSPVSLYLGVTGTWLLCAGLALLSRSPRPSPCAVGRPPPRRAPGPYPYRTGAHRHFRVRQT